MAGKSKSKHSAEEIAQVLQRIRDGGKFDAVWDCQVLVAVNEKSPLSRQKLNKRLQAELNAANRPRRDARFWTGDKVVCLRNSFFPVVDELMDEDDEDEDIVVQEGDDGRPRLYVANGELGGLHVMPYIAVAVTPRSAHTTACRAGATASGRSPRRTPPASLFAARGARPCLPVCRPRSCCR